jgi:hypothetical protein
MKFHDVVVCRHQRFSIGIEDDSGRYYLSIPVSNGLIDYEEYYELDHKSFERYQFSTIEALNFVQRCRNRQADDLLIIKPGTNRGVAT